MDAILMSDSVLSSRDILKTVSFMQQE